jgi:hypothetical protein
MPYRGEGAAHFTIFHTPKKRQLLTNIGVRIFFGRSSPFLPSRSSVSSFGCMQTQHARQTKVCKGRQVLLSLGTLLPAVLAPSSCHGVVASSCQQRADVCRSMHGWCCMYMPRALESQPAQVSIQHELMPTAMCVDLLLLLLVCFTPPYTLAGVYA